MVLRVAVSGDHVDTRRRATAATGGCFNILIGNAPPDALYR